MSVDAATRARDAAVDHLIDVCGYRYDELFDALGFYVGPSGTFLDRYRDPYVAAYDMRVASLIG